MFHLFSNVQLFRRDYRNTQSHKQRTRKRGHPFFEPLEGRPLMADFSFFASASSNGGGLGTDANGQDTSIRTKVDITGIPDGLKTPIPITISVNITAEAQAQSQASHGLSFGLGSVHAFVLVGSGINKDYYVSSTNGSTADSGTNPSGSYSFTDLVYGPTTISVGGVIIADAESTMDSGASAEATIGCFVDISAPSSSPEVQITPEAPPPSSNPPVKDDGPANDVTGNIQAGDPIDIGTGNVYRSDQDFTTAGTNPLSFTRYYNTFIAPSTVPHPLGAHWTSTFDRYLQVNSATSVTAYRETGQAFNFALVNGVWTPDSDMDYKLTQSGLTWILTDPQDNVETYTAPQINIATNAVNSSGLEVLNTIRSRDGYTQTLTYNGISQLSTVTDSFGRTLSFTYQNGLLSTLTTPDGLVLRYGYGGTAPVELTSVTYPTSPQTSESYDYYSTGLLKDVINQDRNEAASFVYDASNRATEVYTGGNPNVNTDTVSYNDSDGSRTVTNALGQSTLYEFTVLQGVPKVTKIVRVSLSGPWTTRTFTYDANGYEASSTDWNGNVTTFVNDVHGQPLSITQAAGTPLARTTTITYLSNFHLPVQIVAPGLTTKFTYDSNGNVLTSTETDTTTQTASYSTNGESRTWIYTYGPFGELLSADGPRTDVADITKYTYNASGYLATVTDALGHVTKFTSYSKRGLLLAETDPNGIVTTLTYDPMGRLLTSTVATSAGNAVTSYTYDAAGLLTSVTKPDKSVLAYHYDTSGRLIKASDSAGESITYTLDGVGDIIAQAIRNTAGVIVETQSSVYNPLGQLVKSYGATIPEVTSYTYDADGNVISITDPLNHTTTKAYDILNRLIKVTDALGGVTLYAYDAQDNVISVTSPRKLQTSYVYNGFGQTIEVISPDSGTTVYHLDAAGNRVSETDARGIVTNRTFDALNRVTHEIYPASPGENVAYAYDGSAGGNRGIGRLTAFTDASGATTLKYDELGDLITQTQAIAGKAYTTAYVFNLAGNVTQIVYPSGRIVTYTYDSQGRVSGVSTRANSTAPAVTLASNITYEPFGPLASLTYGNGLVMTRTYDADYRLTGIVTRSGATMIQNLSYAYDAKSQLLSIKDALTPAQSEAFTYDALGRLLTASGAFPTISYTYDADSNRLTSTQSGVTIVYTYSATSDRLVSVTTGASKQSLTYYANGDIATDTGGGQAASYSYSNRNRLSQAVVSGTTATSLYDALGERMSETVGGTVTQYQFDASGALMSESNGKTGVVSRTYVWLGSLPLAQIESGGAIEYIHADQTNTPQKMTNTAQAVVWNRVQQPFGTTVSTTGTASSNLRAPGQYADAATGLDYNLNRDYSPALGRYIEADPIGLAGGINAYVYVGQNPVTRSDSLGLCQDCSPNEGGNSLDDAIDDPTDKIFQFLFDLLAVASFATGTGELAAGGVAAADRSFAYYMQIVERLDVSTADNGAVFWSGQGNRAVAEEFAAANGRSTLEMTPGGSWLDGQNLFGPNSSLTSDEASQVWARLSERFSESASGNTIGFVEGAQPGGIFNSVEYPTLLNNPSVSNVITGGH